MMKGRFDSIANKLGSSYAAVNWIANEARKRAEEVEYPILESEAISWVITGEKPKAKGRKRVDYNSMIHIVDDMLSQVDDEDVENCVRATYKISLSEHHLIYCYQSNLNESQKARVRVISNMIWYNIEQEGGFN